MRKTEDKRLLKALKEYAEEIPDCPEDFELEDTWILDQVGSYILLAATVRLTTETKISFTAVVSYRFPLSAALAKVEHVYGPVPVGVPNFVHLCPSSAGENGILLYKEGDWKIGL